LAILRKNRHFFTIVNFTLFQLGWLICVLAAAYNYTAISVLSCAAIIALHLSLLSDSKSELKLILIAGCIGFLVDSLNIAFHVFQTGQPQGLPLAPLWLVALWMLFAISLRHSLAWLGSNAMMSAAFGAVFAPLAYYAGSKLGAVELPQNDVLVSLCAIGLAWSLVTPLLFWLANRKL
jgi:hypothetical protein